MTGRISFYKAEIREEAHNIDESVILQTILLHTDQSNKKNVLKTRKRAGQDGKENQATISRPS